MMQGNGATTMPEEIEGRDVAGWKAQWDAMKRELDELNPRLDAAVYLAQKLSAQVQELGRERDSALGAVAHLRAQLVRERDEAATTVETLTANLEALKQELARVQAQASQREE